MMLRDPVSSASHLLTAVWAVFATLVLIRLTPARSARRFAVLVFGLSMVLLYLASGVFHGLWYSTTSEFRFFQRLDQSAIFLLIAGTNTPALVVVAGGRTGRWFLGLMWGLAALGIACLWLLPRAPHWLVVTNYLGMGWLGLLPVAHYYRVLGWRALNWVWLGAAAYTLGAICELTRWPVISTSPVRIAFHEVMHFTDTAGTIAFFIFVTRFVLPYQKPTPRELPTHEMS